MARLGVPIHQAQARGADGPVSVWDFHREGVRVTLLPAACHRTPPTAATDPAATDWLALAVQALHRFRPQILLTYGGHPASRELMVQARRLGIATVFFLRNLAYRHARTFAMAHAVLVPSEFSRRFYAERIGLPSVVLPSPIRRVRVEAPAPAPHYLTFVNPVPEKGAAVVARIAVELSRRRPNIPLLIVEGRGDARQMLMSPLDQELSGISNPHVLANTPDPRTYYRVSRAVLMPSLVDETFGRVAAEALINGLPVLASTRGALPEVLGDAGFLFELPDRLRPGSLAVPTTEEVAPWVTTIERLWEEPTFAAEHQARARAEARRWDERRLAAAYEDFFQRLVRSHDST